LELCKRRADGGGLRAAGSGRKKKKGPAPSIYRPQHSHY
jgi:hypothetical protein